MLMLKAAIAKLLACKTKVDASLLNSAYTSTALYLSVYLLLLPFYGHYIEKPALAGNSRC